jgi:hypothetical protein
LDLKELGINFWLANGRMTPLGAPVCRSKKYAVGHEIECPDGAENWVLEVPSGAGFRITIPPVEIARFNRALPEEM